LRVVVARPEKNLLDESPIRESWIIDGHPVAKAQELFRSTDGTAISMHWSCTAGTFHWYFEIDETVQILEGEVVVREFEKDEQTLRAGDLALFRAGTWCIWHVPVFVRKIALCRDAMPRLGGSALRVLKRAGRLISSVDLDKPPASSP
jgi:uncharacterized protein